MALPGTKPVDPKKKDANAVNEEEDDDDEDDYGDLVDGVASANKNSESMKQVDCFVITIGCYLNP